MESLTQSLPWLALNSVRGLGPVRINRMVEHFGSAQAALDSLSDALASEGLTAKQVPETNRSQLIENAEIQLEALQKINATVLTLDHPAYPSLLKEIFAPPPVLFVRGQLTSLDRRGIGIVGTRRPTTYGKNVSRFLAEDLARAGVITMSGMARGVDTAAHTACLDTEMPTVAVFGCGIDRVYPAENKALAERIIACGAVISEFPPGTRPEPYNFPRRNRIISGLSSGVVVIESAKRGGALITAHYALQQNREVFAVPGSIFSDQSIGTHELLKSGATPVRNAQDILENIQLFQTGSVAPRSVVSETDLSELLHGDEKKVYGAITGEGIRLDSLADTTSIGPPTLMTVLLNLELRGFIQQKAGNHFVRSGR